MEDLVKAQLNLVKVMKELPEKYEELEVVPKDQFTAEQYLECLEDYFSKFQEHHKALITHEELTYKHSYVKKDVAMQAEDAYYHGKAAFNRILSTFAPLQASTSATSLAPGFTFNSRHKLPPIQTSCKRKRHLCLHSLYTFSGDQRVPSQQSSSERVNGKSASPSRGSSESSRFVAVSLPSASDEVSKSSEIVEIPHLGSAHQSFAIKRKQLPLLRSLSTSGGNHRDSS